MDNRHRDGDDELNSSDMEFEERPNPFFAAGVESIEAIIEHALEDRMLSKKVSKTLTHAEGSPKTEYITALWMNRFTAFRTHTLRKRPEEVPNGAEIERFLASMISKVTPVGNDVPSLSWLKVGFRRILMGLIFKYSAFSLSAHERARMRSVFHQFLNDGLITRQPSREAQWVGAFLVSRMVGALLRQAFDEGTTDWDKTIQKALSMVLIAALSCRCGDIMKTQSETHDLPFLCYDDITIKLVDGNDLNNLVATVLIRNEKAKKFDPRKNRKVLLHVLSEPQHNFLCPIKMILISAMRLGAVQGTIEDILASTAARRDKTVQWAAGRGKSPVLCGFATAAQVVTVDKPAMVDQLRDTVYRAGLYAGVLKAIIPHDMRRGAARDTANLSLDPTATTGLATQVVAAELGQSTISLQKGITRDYVGSSSVDNWSKRVNADIQDPFGSEVTSNVYKKQRVTQVEWLKRYKEAGVDPNDRKATRRVRDAAHKEIEKQWRSDGGEGSNSRPAALLPQSATQINTNANFRKRLEGSDEPKVLSESGMQVIGIADFSTASPSANEDIGDNEDDDIESRIDPRLLASADNIALVVGGGGVDEEEISSEELEEMVFEALDATTQTPSDLLVPGMQFVTLLSRINVIANERIASTKAKRIPDVYRGNGKDEPVLFQHRCRKTMGCGYSTVSNYVLLVHEARCTAESLAKANAEKPFACPEVACFSSFDNANALKMHMDSTHRFVPRGCKFNGCDPEILYDSEKALRKHQKDVHPSWVPKGCPVEDCRSAVQFKTAQALKTHLQVSHQITDKDVLKSHTYVRTRSYAPQYCSYPGCKHPTKFKGKKALINHLEKFHGVVKEDASSYVTLE
ncbi:hypothetical protein VTL71DRAFT_360 [Oculimacula yallundae]|uniref:C2H2-type domain-containing protein n=1 Tax=Oculimacula yallundae TaxID=86028 RepID=A0ABR4CZU2_9HELO